MQLFVQGQSVHAINVSEDTTVDELKEAVSDLEGVSNEDQVLSYGGVPLEDGGCVSDIVPELGTISLTVRVLGGKQVDGTILFKIDTCLVSYAIGKVHGSLARAGKVRGQTPKVRKY